MNLKFACVYQLVDSSTVLGFLQKECGVFGPFEGQCIAEFQSSNKFVDGVLQGFAWVSTRDNPADWCTKPCEVKDAVEGGFWEQGAVFLLTEESSWPIKSTFKIDNFGENFV